MELNRFLPFMKKGLNPLKSTLIFKLKEKFPHVSFGLSVLVASIGVLFLLMFPYLLLTLPSALYDAAATAKDLQGWIDAIILFFLILLAGGFSWAIYKLKFSLPTGLEITKEKFPHLLKLIEELQAEFNQPKIDRIILRDKYEIRVLKTPRSQMPFLNTRTLITVFSCFISSPNWAALNPTHSRHNTTLFFK